MSSSKRGRSLAEVMGSIEAEDEAPADAATPKAAAPVNTLPAAPGVVPVNILVSPADRKRLRQLSLDSDRSLQKLGHEAWNLLLAARGLPPLEPVAANVPSGRKRREP